MSIQNILERKEILLKPNDMKREDIICSDVQYIENYVQRVESRLGAGFCWYIREVWNKDDFKKSELIEAYKEQRREIRDIAQDLLSIS